MEKEDVKKMSNQMAELFMTFQANAPKVSDGNREFDLKVFIHSEPARLLGRYMIEQLAPKGVTNDSIFMNGVLYGIMLAELGLGAYILREKSGEVKS